MPNGQGMDGVCYKQGLTVKENFQQCDVTSKFYWGANVVALIGPGRSEDP
jgi:hypothetical protein